ncbi:MAG: heavy-metal-associated domain-containing protein [Actinobacteria bacterium]|nr:heavy-metal-associated domain-containing protein [Actinomycetota bacterium]
MSISTYTVVGMTCAHCLRSVIDEVTQVAGVGEVDVDLRTGVLTVTSADPSGVVDDAAVRAAVAEAGYGVVERPGARE